ncbi:MULTISPECIES: hypothetical protein [unclassified Archaeoglobus]|jgi:DNA-binding transcriptional regulator YhcF (GntR family)|uniref:hypothetical protein n=1 Tax=unclassified Archaeoglobus TaxID=2643606 RepID=UPI0025BE3A6B|nr:MULTISPECIES: hypothetical protein [unclassified Archaeoglobus]
MLSYLFGDAPIIKILDFLLDEWELDFSKADVARETGVSWKTVNEVWGTLEKFGLIEYTRTVNRAKMYRVKKNNLFKTLKRLDMEILALLDRDDQKQEVTA